MISVFRSCSAELKDEVRGSAELKDEVRAYFQRKLAFTHNTVQCVSNAVSGPIDSGCLIEEVMVRRYGQTKGWDVHSSSHLCPGHLEVTGVSCIWQKLDFHLWVSPLSVLDPSTHVRIFSEKQSNGRSVRGGSKESLILELKWLP